MAKIILNPIATPQSATHPSERIQQLEAKLEKERTRVRLGWGETYQQRVRDKHRLTARERVAQLADVGSRTFEILTFVNDGLEFGSGSQKRTSPAAGVITALVRVHDRLVMCIANDNTVASGSWWPKTPEKIIRAQSIALKLKLPVVYMVDCSGLFLPEQSKTFPGEQGAGHIFKMNSLLSSQGVPQIAGVFGDCIAGGGYMPIISDKVYMTEQAYMVIAGAALIQGAKAQNLKSTDIGGADVHVHLSNCADVRVPDDATCVRYLRAEIEKMASSSAGYYRAEAQPAPPRFPASELNQIIPDKLGGVYDVREVIGRLVDDSLFKEVMPDRGGEVVVGVGRISGLYVGIVANCADLSQHPENPSQKRPGGILYREGVAKLSMFSRACNDDGIPIVWLQDVSGFDVGVEAERQGLLGYGSSLIYTNSTNQTPMMTVLLRKASGAGYYAMSGLPYEPVLQLATPLTRLAVMEGRTLAIGAFNSRLDDNFQIVASSEEERAAIEKGMQETEARIEADMDPYKAASQMDVDELVQFGEIRDYLEAWVEACYQSQGARRIKNPRIWSLHDLDVMLKVSGPAVHSNQVSLQQTQTRMAEGPVYTASMDGMLYLRPSPADPFYLREGELVHPGQTIGLLEVMKCFYPLLFEGKQAVRVRQILLQDASSIRTGDPIFSFEQLGSE